MGAATTAAIVSAVVVAGGAAVSAKQGRVARGRLANQARADANILEKRRRRTTTAADERSKELSVQRKRVGQARTQQAQNQLLSLRGIESRSTTPVSTGFSGVTEQVLQEPRG